VNGSAGERQRLKARIAALEEDHRRSFDEAQREADALFAQYQLSQLLASGGSPAALGETVLVELVRLAGAEAGAIWLGAPARSQLDLLATTGQFRRRPPKRLPDLAAGRRLAVQRPELHVAILRDEGPATLLALQVPLGTALDADGLRVAVLARHELAVAFGASQMREAFERERHELAAVLNGATDIIIQVDEDRRVVRINPAGERILATDAASVMGRTCSEVLGCLAAGAHRADECPLAEVLASGSAIAYRETVIQSTLGRPKVRVAGGYSRTSGQPGGAMRATAILRDITAIRALEELREGFVATVSHELRTPLALVRGYAETLLHFELDVAQQRDYVDRIQRVTSRLGSLVDQILDVTHIDADPLVLERAPAAFAALVARARGDLALSGDDQRLIVELPATLPPIHVDAERVGRVLDNLIGNAIKYAPDGSSIVIRASVDGDWLVVTVDDEGVGIPDGEHALVLEPFHRAWNVRESRIPGTGLGLYICRRLVEAHGGRLWLENRPDGRPGTRVAFTLPLLAGRRVATSRLRTRSSREREASGAVDG